MKISEKIIRISLVLLILLSIFLSYNIWLSPANTISINDTSGTVNAENQNSRNADDVFLPLKLIWLQNGAAQGTQSETAISQVQDLLPSNIYGTLEEFASDDENFAVSQIITNGIELTYQGSYLLSDYLSTFKINLEDTQLAEDFYFSKIQIDFDNQLIKFINFSKNAYLQGEFSSTGVSYRQILEDNSLSWTDVALDETSRTGQYNSNEPILLSRYSYILSTQSFTLFRNAFFQDPENVTDDDASVFMSGQERLEIDSDRQLAEFQGELPLTEDLDDEFNQSFAYISHLGTSVGNLRYFDRDGNRLNYRVFVEGYPVFGNNSQGLVSVTVDNEFLEDSVKIGIESSTRTIQIPIPANEMVELPSTQTVHENIINVGGNNELVSSIIIGYTWEAILNADRVPNDRVVDLTPEWYVRYNDQWYAESDLISQLSNVEVD